MRARRNLSGEANLRELVRASRKAEVKGHGSTRTVKCPYCDQLLKRTIILHLRKEHAEKWQQWRVDMLQMYNEGLTSIEIARECYMLFTWGIIEKEILKLSEEKGIPLKPRLNRTIEKWNSEGDLQRTSVWRFGKRGMWAVHDGRYRGNYAPQVPNEIIRRYSKEGEIVLDPFLGGGTTTIESWLLGRRSIGIDVSPHAISISETRIEEMEKSAPNSKLIPAFKPIIRKGDARQLSFIEDNSVDLVCTQPPYLNAIRYTESVSNDISHISDSKEFCQEFNKVARELFRVLKRGRICAVQMGDTRKHGKFVPLGFLTLNELISVGFDTKNIIVKLQYADRSTRFYKFLKELQLAHEYILLLEKSARARCL